MFITVYRPLADASGYSPSTSDPEAMRASEEAGPLGLFVPRRFRGPRIEASPAWYRKLVGAS